MRITQGTFSYLPDLTDEEIRAQIQYGIDQGWAVSIEYTDDPHPRNVYWHLWGMPMFDLQDAAGAVYELNRCRESFPDQYIRVSLYNPTLTKQTTGLQFIVQRPPVEPGFRIDRPEKRANEITYHLYPYVADRPHGRRYENGARSD